MPRKKKLHRRKPKLTPAEKSQKKIEKRYYQEFKHLFKNLGFVHVKSDGVQIRVDGRMGEIDDLFVYENVLIVMEYTVGKPSSAHILKKKPLYDKILADVPSFLDVARESFPELSDCLSADYTDDQYHIRIIYAPLKEADSEVIQTCPSVYFLQGGLQKYFFALGKTIQKSARVEFFSYLKLDWDAVGDGVLSAGDESRNYAGQLLPESKSSFPPGYKVVSFYADPENLIAGAYVLRRDGWRDSSHLYQRVLLRSKITKMRRYLTEQGRVFVNNVIVTLPSTTTLNHPGSGRNVADRDLNKALPVTISIPVGYSTIGIIDGQHRVFCYHEGDDKFEDTIKALRKRQHLLVTGIIYPPEMKELARLEFEARLFLEINDTQTRARPALRQDIETIVRPFSGIAVARRVIAELARHGPYQGLFQLAYFDAPTKIKTSSIVSYGLRPIVKFDGADSLFFAWSNAEKTKLKAREKRTTKGAGYEADLVLLNEYIEFCVKNLNDFFLAAKLSYGTNNWDVEDASPSALLRPTSINGLVACLRRIIQNGKPLSLAAHKERLDGLKNFKFDNYTSSSWDALGQTLYDKYYKN